ncbi:hypothetical protein N7488_002921 [Penicillium malachiteum]|nr:hypothetical protein N7488_002921 [Penicillium malachiteum]
MTEVADFEHPRSKQHHPFIPLPLYSQLSRDIMVLDVTNASEEFLVDLCYQASKEGGRVD